MHAGVIKSKISEKALRFVIIAIINFDSSLFSMSTL